MRFCGYSVVGLLTTICLTGAHIIESGVHQLPIRPTQQQSEDSFHHDELSEIISSSPLLSLHRAICEVQSISNDELAVAKLLITTLKAHNFIVQAQHVPPMEGTNSTKERLNIYAFPDPGAYGTSVTAGRGSKPKVLLTSHIDTVPPHIPYSLSLPQHSKPPSSRRKDILISGRGTVDDKACVAVQTIAILNLLSDSKISPSDVALLFVVGEETIGDGMKHFSESNLYSDINSDLKAVIFGEPTELKLASGHKGIVGLRITAQGKAAHSGYPWLGRSANSMILPALMVLDGLGDLPEDKGGLPRSKKYGRSTVNIGYMQGGVAGNVVPEHATASITIRLAGGTPTAVRRLITRAIRAVDPEGLLGLFFSQGYAPINLDADVPGFEEITVNYGTDIPGLKVQEGVKRYLYGPGSILVAHGEDEGLTVGDLESSEEGYQRLILHALGL
jgi:acetylornithine deacetylase